MPPPGGIFLYNPPIRKGNTMNDNNNGRSDDQMKCVYMGPPMRRNLLAYEPVLEEVYMGPPPEDEEEPEPLPEPVPQKAAEADRRLMEGVYAGPDISPMAPVYAGPRRPTGQMMMVYAGPEYFAKRRSTQEDQTGTPSPEDKGKPTICPVCGSPVAQGRFCSECGASLPGTLMVKCPGCGSIVRKGRFCPECGMLFSQEENAPAAEESSHQL